VRNVHRALMTTVSDGGAAGSPRASWLFMPASRTGQVSVRNLRPETPAISSAYIPPSRKTGQVLVRTLRHEKTGFQPDKMAMSGGLKLPPTRYLLTTVSGRNRSGKQQQARPLQFARVRSDSDGSARASA